MLFASCSNASKTPATEGTTEAVSKKISEESSQDKDDMGVLVIYFSFTGTTKGVAEKIAKVTDADLFEIEPVEPYTDEDRDWTNSKSRASKEQNDDSARPEIKNKDVDIDGYSKIFIGYPIWFSQEPRIMDTFVEGIDFGDTTVIPFCTSGSSGIEKTGLHLGELATGGNWDSGRRFDGDVPEDELKEWVDSLG